MTGAGKGRPAGMAILDTEAGEIPRVVGEPSSNVGARDEENTVGEEIVLDEEAVLTEEEEIVLDEPEEIVLAEEEEIVLTEEFDLDEEIADGDPAITRVRRHALRRSAYRRSS